jgi:hypothetical protein
MTIYQYCWRCKISLPMLEEHEWKLIEPFLSRDITTIQRYRENYGVGLGDVPRHVFGVESLAMYEKITGYTETNFNAIWHHRASLYGSPCRTCGYPLRTPRASFCAHCGNIK